MKRSRYTVTLVFDIQAKDSDEAVDKAKIIAEEMRKECDNQAFVSEVESNPFGSLTAVKIYKRKND